MMDSNLFSGVNAAQVITAVSTTGVFAAVLTFVLRWRSLTNSAETKLRDHYAAELVRLTGKVEEKERHILEIEGHLRKIIKTADERYDECQRERDKDRQEFARMRAAMHDEIEGLKRQIPELSADALLILEARKKPGERPSDTAPEATKAAKRLHNGDK